MLFLDLEYLVPIEDRGGGNGSGSLVFNPSSPHHIVLGGIFASKPLLVESPPEFRSFWIWNYQDDEALMLHALCQYFTEQWEIERQQKACLPPKTSSRFSRLRISCGN